MNNILVGIDFEEGSFNALDHAVAIAQKAKLDILCVWVYKPESSKEKESSEIIQEAEKQLQQLIKQYQPHLKENKIEYKIREGKIYREIVAEAKETKPYLIAIGTHGASGFEEFWIGSNANKIVSASPYPTLTIRSGRTIKKQLKTIIMPVDSSLETRQKAPITGVMAKYFDATVHVVKVYTTQVKAVRRRVDGYADQVVKYFNNNEVNSMEVPLEVDNLATGVIEYAESVDANLIVIMTEQETKTSNIWMGPYAHQMVNHSPIPILSIHPKQMLISLAR